MSDTGHCKQSLAPTGCTATVSALDQWNTGFVATIEVSANAVSVNDWLLGPLSARSTRRAGGPDTVRPPARRIRRPVHCPPETMKTRRFPVRRRLSRTGNRCVTAGYGIRSRQCRSRLVR
jgi:hypothetical protein